MSPPAPAAESGSTRHLLLGVDGGGTSTDAWLAESATLILGRGRSGPANAKAVGLEAARRAIAEAIDRAFRDAGIEPRPVEAACLGIAGFGRPDDREVLVRWSGEAGWCRRLILATDGDLVVAAGTPEGWGVGLISGTGSIAVARAPDGRTSRAGGWGFLMGDEGSAYAVAVEALKWVARRADGRLPSPPPGPDGQDPLTRALCRALGVDQPSRIIARIHAPDFDRTRIAALAPAVLEAAEEDPAVSAGLIRSAGEDLAGMVMAAARALDLDPAPLPLATAGGFLLAAEPIHEALVEELAAHGYNARVSKVAEPVRGAVVLAERALSA